MPAVVYRKKIDAGAGFIIIRSKSAVAHIPRDSASLLCNPCYVWGCEKPQKDIFVPHLPYTQPHRTNCPNGSYFLELFGTHRAHFTYATDREGYSIILYIGIGNIILVGLVGPNFPASCYDFRIQYIQNIMYYIILHSTRGTR